MTGALYTMADSNGISRCQSRQNRHPGCRDGIRRPGRSRPDDQTHCPIHGPVDRKRSGIPVRLLHPATSTDIEILLYSMGQTIRQLPGHLVHDHQASLPDQRNRTAIYSKRISRHEL